MEAVGEGWGQIVKDVGIVEDAVDDDERWTRSSPVKIVQADSVGGNNATLVPRIV